MIKDKVIQVRCTQNFKERLEDIADTQTGGDVSKLIMEILYRAILYREKEKAKGRLRPIDRDKLKQFV